MGEDYISFSVDFSIFHVKVQHVFILDLLHIWYPRLVWVGKGKRGYKQFFEIVLVKKISGKSSKIVL